MRLPFRSYWQLLRSYLLSARLQFSLLTAMLLGAIGLEIANPQILRAFVDGALAGRELAALVWLGGTFLVVALLHQSLKAAANYVGEDVAWRATNLMRLDLTAHCVDLDMGFHNDSSPGELIEWIDGDIEQIAKFFSQLVIQVVGNVVLLVGILAALFVEDWRIGSLFLLFSALTLLALNAVRSIAVKHDRTVRQADADLYGFLEERLGGTEEIRSSGSSGYILRGLFALQTRILRLTAAARMREVLVHVVAGVALAVGYTIALIAGYYLFQAGALSVGTVFLLVQYTNLVARPIRHA